MSNINVQQVIAQMRVLEAQAKSQITPSEMGVDKMGANGLSVNETGAAQKTEFSEILANSVNSINDNFMQAGKMSESFQKGDSNITMAELMINMEKASVSFQAMTSVRNKLLTAYQDIMNMPV
ncbi:Flagellar hook-basal body complex protein FliE [hydrothermal vent metagenome]|uniref:Flagellar hook-basal body complex protein FliE n=1 Tax=hydrothermal vent metagenome TaxID=652676 RepID=A0A3B0XHJ5_9ZZZZ